MASNCGSNTDWEIWYPHNEEVETTIGSLWPAGAGPLNAQNCQVRIYDSTDAELEVGVFDVAETFWFAEVTRDGDWPLGSASAKVYCSNGGPHFHIGGTYGFTFVAPL
jgi:hypothetical protein